LYYTEFSAALSIKAQQANRDLMLDPALDIGDVPTSVALVPGPIELLRGGPKLDDKVDGLSDLSDSCQ